MTRIRDLIPGEVKREMTRRAEIEDVRRLERRRLVRSDVDRLLGAMGLLG
jgi:hypothetical protein